MAQPTIDPSMPSIDGRAFAFAWQAAASAAARNKADATLDRALVIEVYRTREGRPAGLQFVGYSRDLVVAVQVPYAGSSHPSSADLYELILDGAEPSERYPIDDRRGHGALLVRQIDIAAKVAEESGGVLNVALTPTSYVTPGSLGSVMGMSVIDIAADGITDATHVYVAQWKPRPWRDAFPTTEPIPMPAGTLTESRGLYARLNRLTRLLPLDEVSWEFYRLPDGRITRYLHQTGDGWRLDVSMAIAPASALAGAVLWDGPASLEEAAYPDQPLPIDDESDTSAADEEWEDPERINVIRGAFGP